MFEKREIYRAIAELAYIVAKAHDGLKLEEKKAFFEIINKELEFEAWSAESRFSILDRKKPTLEHGYNAALYEIKKYKNHLTDELKDKTLRVVRKVADAYKGTSEVQAFIISRLESDLKRL